eukprot:TRINITY_DN3717_c0_g1_i7.p1 TRINITY_DN3717_c0_g1~~TRINITY_DN3717_c0_g1_i7.p1  ORF type:complete len:406 (-),score=57.02 TRINITY_DN3717_c0_g1_i7:2-1219(-)
MIFHNRRGMFGLYNAYTNQVIPLKHIDIQVECKGQLALIKQTQFYHNPTDEKIESVYCFPKALIDCFYGMEISIEGLKVISQIKEREQAKADFVQAIEAEQTAVIGEINSVHTPGVVRIQIGNIAPRTTDLQVTFMYTQELSIAYEKFWKIHIPSTLTPRYYSSKNTEVEARSQGQRRVRGQQRVREEFKQGELLTFIPGISHNDNSYTWDILVRIEMTSPNLKYHCPTHSIDTRIRNGRTLEVSLSQDENHYPDKDFVFYFRTDSLKLESKYVTRYSDNVNQYAASISFIPDLGTDTNDLMSRLVNSFSMFDNSGLTEGIRIASSKKALFNLSPIVDLRMDTDSFMSGLDTSLDEDDFFNFSNDTNSKADFYFVLDKSGSMEGIRIEKLKEALLTFINLSLIHI